MPKPISVEKKIEWEARIHQQRESGLSIDRWCRQNQLTSCSFHYWKNRFQPTSANSLVLVLPNCLLIKAQGFPWNIREFAFSSINPSTLQRWEIGYQFW